MKKCGYCGRENTVQSDRCVECGGVLTEAAIEQRTEEPRDRVVQEWLATSLRYAGVLITIALLYLLSFGPVDHYCKKIVTRTTAPTSYTSNTYNSAVTIVTVRYPRWVGILYRPALYLRFQSELYHHYIAVESRR